MEATASKVSANTCEIIFDEFIGWFGGEFASDVFPNPRRLPSNADYLLFERSVVAELKCLQKDFFRDLGVKEKIEKLMQRWMKQGKIPADHIRDNGITIPENLAPKVVEIFMPPIKSAVEKANRQIKHTKAALGIDNAKGLLILVNERNSSLTPPLALNIMARLLKKRYSHINSYVYVVPTMQLEATALVEPGNLWMSGDARIDLKGINPSLLSSLQSGWVSFLESKYGHKVRIMEPPNPNIIQDLGFVR